MKKIIRAGRLCRNGEPVTRPETKLDPEKDELLLDGKPLLYETYEYWVLNKPAGVLSATEDPRHRTVIDYMGLTRKGMAPCGRLDLDTEGFLLVTDDGAMVHRLLSPAKHVDKCYEVTYDGKLPADAVRRFAEGITLEDGTLCRPADLIPGCPAILTIREGKFHQVKRMFLALGCPVTHLRRLSMGPLSLEALGLGPGEYRKLTPEETEALKQFCISGGLPGTAPDPDSFDACILSVKMILGSIGAHPADDALDVLDLGRELGVLRGTVVRADDGIAGVQQGVHDGAEVGHALGVVGVPGAAVDVDHDRVGV